MRKTMLAALMASAALSASPAKAEDAARPRQLVLISFDGAHDLNQWNRARQLGRDTGARFTFFLSCTFVMSRSERAAYQAPHQRRARSNTGFALSDLEAQARLNHIWQAHLEGHEMANHACGHFDGKDWSTADWLSEFQTFDRVMAEAWVKTGIGTLEPDGWRDFVARDIKGFRAPYLSTGAGLLPALKAHGFRYDASLVNDGPAWPRKASGLHRFGLPRIAEGLNGRKVIAMDYNLFIRHSGGFEQPSRADEFASRTLSAFRAAFDAEYFGARKPLELGFHFSLMNDGAYWQALAIFARETCSMPDVACVSYSEALDGLAPVAQAEADDTAF